MILGAFHPYLWNANYKLFGGLLPGYFFFTKVKMINMINTSKRDKQTSRQTNRCILATVKIKRDISKIHESKFKCTDDWMSLYLCLMCKYCDLTRFDGGSAQQSAGFVSGEELHVDRVEPLPVPLPQWRLFGSSWPKWRECLCWAGSWKTSIIYVHLSVFVYFGDVYT